MFWCHPFDGVGFAAISVVKQDEGHRIEPTCACFHYFGQRKVIEGIFNQLFLALPTPLLRDGLQINQQVRHGAGSLRPVDMAALRERCQQKRRVMVRR